MGGATLNDVGSLGLNHLPGDAGKFFNTATWALPGLNILKGAGAVQRTVAGMGTPAKTVADSMSVMEQQRSKDAAALNDQLLKQPKNISPDNFLASKNRMLQNMRLGLAAGFSGGGGAPSPVLSAPTLTGSGPGKTKLGS